MTQFDFLSGRRPTAHATQAMIACSHSLASAAGLAILAEGGSAADAAICANAVQCVVDPHMTGIGGDCFVLYAPKGGKVRALNGSGRAPAGASIEALRAAGVSELTQTSPHSITVPGAVSAWCKLHAEYGRLPLERVLAPAIRYGEEGFPVSARVAHDFAQGQHTVQDEHTARVLFPGGRAPVPGDVLRQPLLAARFREVAQHGAEGFYTGDTAARMVRHLRHLGGLHTEEDFHNALEDGATWEDPIRATYRGREVLECGPNGQGLAALIILRILEGFDMGPGTALADRIHLQAEATKLAYHHRNALIGDPRFARDVTAELLSDAAIDTMRARIDPRRASTPVLWTEPEHKDTIYLCAVDAEGNAISFINSIFHAFGSTRMDPETGVLFHCRGLSFNLEEGHPNAIAPGKRPMHTIIPAMVMEGDRALMPFGVMGGHYQAAGHGQFLSHVLDRDLDLQTAMDQPRSFANNGLLEVERTVPSDALAVLAARGHRISTLPGPTGGSQAIRIDHGTGMLSGGSDSRKDGMAIGF